MGDKTVYVGPTAQQVTPEPARIGPWDHVFWRTQPAGHKLLIVFNRSGFPPGVNIPPFAGMLANGNDFSVPCSGDSCTSGPVNLDLPHTGSYTYKYNQILDNQRYDGHIIIQW